MGDPVICSILPNFASLFNLDSTRKTFLSLSVKLKKKKGGKEIFGGKEIKCKKLGSVSLYC